MQYELHLVTLKDNDQITNSVFTTQENVEIFTKVLIRCYAKKLNVTIETIDDLEKYNITIGSEVIKLDIGTWPKGLDYVDVTYGPYTSEV